jgi:hypothetical protein
MSEDANKKEERRRLDNLFNIALVLITVLGASEFVFVTVVNKNISDIKYYFWVFTYPIVTLIIAWILKEFISGSVEVPQDASKVRITNFVRDTIIFLTEFCWFFWATILYYFLNFFVSFVAGNISVFTVIFTGIIFVVLFYEIRSAYVKTLVTDYFVRDYYTKRKLAYITMFALILSVALMLFYTLFPF